MRRFRPAALLLGVGLALSGASLVSPVEATTAAPSAQPGQSGSWKVTLLTGDVVRVHTVTGKPPMVSVQPGAGREKVQFVKSIKPNGTVNVIPLDVGSLVGKVLDPALFDVTALIRDGDDDARRGDLPLIVQSTGGTPSYFKNAARAKPARRLKGLSAVALHQPKSKAIGGQLASMSKAVRKTGKATDGVRHIWLDRVVHTTALTEKATTALDGDLIQIGAPAAWRAGDTGKGVKVAVLDTGVDATHPDLTGQIAEAKNFSTSADTVDRFGHGTHVAATIAGTGAASKGQRRGVAFGASLVIGKVLDDDGYGSDSGVIAGMEWAATQAKVVNMSLGSDFFDPANDPISDAVTTLTAKYNTLFVVAAGNSGPGVGTVGSPGVTDAALTVGAVDGQDKLAAFSSVGGPNSKPDIAAPGVNTISARAAGTSMGTLIDGSYTAASGTSMATPHVTGAAAVLAQEHPGWSPAQLKDALIASAHPVDANAFQVGAGRLDLAAAISTTVIPDQPAAAFGTIASGSTAVTKTLSWTNTGAEPVTLPLTAQLTGTDAVHVSVDKVTVPAGGSASATLTLDPGKLSPGFFTGTVDAGGLRTPIGLYDQPQIHTVTFKATALPGTPDDALGGYVQIINLDEPDLATPEVDFDSTGIATVQLPAGRYSMLAQVADVSGERSALVGLPEVTVKDDITLPLDASAAQPLKASAPGFSTSQTVVHLEQSSQGWTWGFDIYGVADKVFSTPTAAVDVGSVRAYAGFHLANDSGTTVYDLLHDLGAQVPASIDYAVDPADLARIDQRFGALNGDTATAVHEQRYGLSPAGFLIFEPVTHVTPGATRTDYVSGDTGVRWLDEAVSGALDKVTDYGGWVTEVPARRFEPGSRQTSEWLRQPFRPGPYSGTGETPSGCAPRPTTRRSGDINVELVDLQNLPDGFDCLTNDATLDSVTSRTMRLYAGGRQVGSASSNYADFSVPATAGTYRLTYDVDFSKALPVSTKTSTAWTFRSAPPATRAGARPVPLLAVDYRLPLNLLNQPDGDTATFAVARVANAPAAKVTGFRLWTSTDDGTTWSSAKVTAQGDGKYAAALPAITTGQHVSLRVDARDAGGSRIEQTIIRAY